MNSEREKIRNIKNDLDFYSADRSKAKYEIRKDINLQRSKLREEEKKARVSISCLNQ
jgi:t-SNARE complex subunit (syntaxin)